MHVLSPRNRDANALEAATSIGCRTLVFAFNLHQALDTCKKAVAAGDIVATLSWLLELPAGAVSVVLSGRLRACCSLLACRLTVLCGTEAIGQQNDVSVDRGPRVTKDRNQA